MTDNEIILLARIAHGANREWEMHFCPETTIPTYTESSNHHYLSFIRGYVEGLTNEQIHYRFCEEKRAQGWQYGERDLANKHHPYLCPYELLNNKMRLRYVLFRRIVETYQEYLGSL